MSSDDKPLAVCLVGPTAAGKTDLAVRLVQRFPFEIISVDSAMVYRHMDIGTGKPGPDVLSIAPHRLIDIRDPWDSYSAGQFCADAQAAMAEIYRAGRVPLLVGGTLLYFRALQEGLAPLPEADPDVRRQLDARGENEGWPALHAELASVDPAAAARIGTTDRQRIQRALEVYMLTGEPITELQAATKSEQDTDFLRIALIPSNRAELYARIESRFERMVQAGFLQEVAGLRSRDAVRADSTAMRAVGYRQLWAHLDGVISLAEAKQRAKIATRRLAKRQLSWLRSEPDERQFDCLAPNVADQVSGEIRGRIEKIGNSQTR
jgi:tRNA dimethylallyltransferase